MNVMYVTNGEHQAFPGDDDLGMTIREKMATQIMAGFAAAVPDRKAATAARDSVVWADALIAALNEGRVKSEEKPK